ncbi:hypothetical protein [Streptomyces sp. NPDC046261]|uniref:hypothetical protein n=1 Tax=Streptomyces sp. NPDC046261 TaxID=3157200 RepID=UPI00340E0F28
MRKAAYAATALAIGAAAVTFGGGQAVQAKGGPGDGLLPLPQLVCPDATATVHYSEPFKLRGLTNALETSDDIKFGTEASGVPCADTRLHVPGGKRVTGGHGRLIARKTGNCSNVDAMGTAQITWTKRVGTKHVPVGESTINYSASGPIVDTVITSGTVDVGDTFGGTKVINNSINSDDPAGTLAKCSITEGLVKQGGRAQFTLWKY